MKIMHTVIVAVLLGLGLAPAPCTAQDDPYGDLFLSSPEPVPTTDVQPRSVPVGETTRPVVTTPQPSADELKKQQLERDILPKLYDQYNTLTRDEFMVYLEMVEALNPLCSWQQIVTKLHAAAYPEDVGRDVPVIGVPLFRDGPENAGWDKVTLPGRYVPKFVVGEDGKPIDIAHAYAGLRAGLNRGRTGSWWMSRVNTGWGDSYQVGSARLGATGDILAGIFTFDGDRISQGAGDWSNAPQYKTEAQKRGNEVGLKVQTYLEKTDPKATLSEGFRHELYPQRLTTGPSFGQTLLRTMTYAPMGPIMPSSLFRR